MNTTTIILIVVAVIVVLTVIIVLWCRSRKVIYPVEYGQQKCQLKRVGQSDGVIYTYEFHDGQQTKMFNLGDKDCLEADIPMIDKYYELQAIRENGTELPFCLPYLGRIRINVKTEGPLKPGRYSIRIKTTANEIPEIWKEHNFISINTANENLQQGINVHKQLGGMTDAQHYHNMGDHQFEKSKQLYDKGYEYVYAESSKSLASDSQAIHIQHYNLHLESNQVALVCIPNRTKTMMSKVEDILTFNGKVQEADAEQEEMFTTYKISGKHLSDVDIKEYLLGCAVQHHVLIFYVYVFEKSD